MKTKQNKSDVAVEMLGKAAEQLRQLADEVVAERLGKAEPPKEVQGVSAMAGQLRKLAGELVGNSKEVRRLMLSGIELLLAGSGMLCSDTTKYLEEERAYLASALNEIGEIDSSLSQIDLADAQITIQNIEERLDTWSPAKQAAILHDIASRLPEKQVEDEKETAANEACEELLNYVGNEKTLDEQKAFYEQALAAVKAGNGNVPLKATA